MRAVRAIVSMGGIGYLPASGTWASLVTLAPLFLIRHPGGIAALFLISLAVSLILCAPARKAFASKDPSPFVLDEFCGMAMTVLFVPISAGTLVVGFFLFRFFDIAKPLGVRKIDAWDHPSAIVWDDVAAGLYANLILRAVVRLFPALAG